jgi:hypothetical protein
MYVYINFIFCCVYLFIYANVSLSFFIFCLVSNYFPILLLIIIAIRNVCRIIIWKDLNWKMCKKDPYNCFVVYIYSFMQMFHNNCSITLYITVNKQIVIFRSKTMYTGPLPQLCQFRSQLKFLQGANFFEPKQWMIACTTTSFMYKWSRFGGISSKSWQCYVLSVGF